MFPQNLETFENDNHIPKTDIFYEDVTETSNLWFLTFVDLGAENVQ